MRSIFCEIILNLDQWFRRRCHVKYFLSTASSALLFGGVVPFVQFWWRAFCSVEQAHLCNCGKRHYKQHFCEITLNVDQWYRRRCLKYFYLLLWWPFCLVRQNHLCNCGRGLYEKHFCEIILSLDQWFKRYSLKIFLSTARDSGPFVWLSGTICAILVEGNMRNIFCEISLNLDQWFMRRCRLKYFLPTALVAFFQRSGTICSMLAEGIMGNIPLKLL